jgi:MurNAc alpha-1-phosphate uridylyltransferase
MQAVILAGGLGTRMRPVTETLPKSLLPVHGRAFIDYQLEQLRRGGITQVVLCVGYLGDLVAAHVGDGRRHGLAVAYSFERGELLGTAGALKLAQPLLRDGFLITWGDSYVPLDHRAVFREHREARGRKATMVVFENRGAWDSSNAEVADGRVIRYEKTSHDARLAWIDAGVSVLNRAVLDEVPANEPAALDGVFARLAAAGELGAYEASDRFYEVGSPAGYAAFLRFAAELK